MGIRECRDAFNEISRPAATCVKALMDTVANGSQILYFSGSYANGEGFVIESKLIPPSADLVLASRETAEAFLQRERAT